MKPHVIALAGRAGSGKDTCADWLARNRGARKYSFAEPLKRLAMDVFGWSERQVFGTQAEKERIDPVEQVQVLTGPTSVYLGDDQYSAPRMRSTALSPRDTLIRLGEGARRWIGEDVWARACLERIEADTAKGERVLGCAACAKADHANDGTECILHHWPPRIAVISDCRYRNEASIVRAFGGVVFRLRCPDADSKVDRNAPSERSVDEIPKSLIIAEINEPRSPGAARLLAAFERAVMEVLG